MNIKTNKEAIKLIELNGEQVPFSYGLIWLEEGEKVDSEQILFMKKMIIIVLNSKQMKRILN
ncbi:hypothetical protein G5716_14055 [Bacillus pacificus]|nr:hypothetical protein [Bacillus pacificus]